MANIPALRFETSREIPAEALVRMAAQESEVLREDLYDIRAIYLVDSTGARRYMSALAVPLSAGGGEPLVVRPNGAKRKCERNDCEEPRTCLYYCTYHHWLICQRKEGPMPKEPPTKEPPTKDAALDSTQRLHEAEQATDSMEAIVEAMRAVNKAMEEATISASQAQAQFALLDSAFDRHLKEADRLMALGMRDMLREEMRSRLGAWLADHLPGWLVRWWALRDA